MYKVAIVDDDEEQLKKLKGFIKRYSEEKGEAIEVDAFKSGVDFLTDYKFSYNIVFLDIEMPGMDGMETAQQIRKIDQSIVIIFITQMAQYAIRGYEVDAIDFVVKPVDYFMFRTKMDKAITFSQKRREREFIVSRYDDVVRLKASEVYYIEKNKNYLLFHSKRGEYTCRGTIAEYEEELLTIGFSKPINGCLVNLYYVTKLEDGMVYINGDMSLPISRAQKKQFMKDCLQYFSRGK